MLIIVDKEQRPISKFLNIEWIVSFVCNVIFYNISVNQVGSFIGTVLKKNKPFKLAYDNYIDSQAKVWSSSRLVAQGIKQAPREVLQDGLHISV
jgi:hypothetical protein